MRRLKSWIERDCKLGIVRLEGSGCILPVLLHGSGLSSCSDQDVYANCPTTEPLRLPPLQKKRCVVRPSIAPTSSGNTTTPIAQTLLRPSSYTCIDNTIIPPISSVHFFLLPFARPISPSVPLILSSPVYPTPPQPPQSSRCATSSGAQPSTVPLLSLQ